MAKTPQELQMEAFRRAARMAQQPEAGVQPSATQTALTAAGQRPPAMGAEDYAARTGYESPATREAVSEERRQLREEREEAAVPAPIQRQAGPSRFVTFQQQLAANQAAAQRMLRQLSSRVEDQGDPSRLLQTQEGREALLERAYGGATELDAALAGAAAPADYFSRLEAQYGAEAQKRAAEAARAEAERLRLEAQRAADAEVQRRAAEDAATAAADREAETKSAQRARVAAIGERPSDAAWAAYHGMTLKEWIDNGRNPPLPY